MRDQYYEDHEDIPIDDLDDDEWLDDEPDEPVQPARKERAWAPRRQEPRRQESRPQRARSERSTVWRARDYIPADPRDAVDQTGHRKAPAAATGTLSPWNDLLLLVFKIGLVIAFLIFMTTFFFGVTQARDTSMEPAVKEGDIVIYYRPDKTYASGDAIVVDYDGKLQVRRVVATAGDTVDISSEGGLIINGSTQIESDIYTQTLPYTEGITFPVTVGDGEVFVLGDDRTSAEDSRIYGTVRISTTKGAVMTVIRRRGI